MNTKFIPPELQDTVVGLDGQRPSGSVLESIGNGRYAVTLPDGQQVIVDQHGNIIGGNPKCGGLANPTLRFSHMTNFYP